MTGVQTCALPIYDNEGTDHYYLGTMRPGELVDSSLLDKGQPVSVFETEFTLDHPVDQGIYDYIVGA